MIYMFLANGFEETEAIAPLDLLRRGGAEVKTVAVGTAKSVVTGSHGIPVTADIKETDSDFSDAEMVILPGGLPGAHNLFASDQVALALSTAHKNGGYLAAICAAPYILGERGYLRGKRATCYPGFEDKLIGAEKIDAPVVRDGNIITAEAAGAAISFGLELVSALYGKEAADKLASAIIKR